MNDTIQASMKLNNTIQTCCLKKNKKKNQAGLYVRRIKKFPDT